MLGIEEQKGEYAMKLASFSVTNYRSITTAHKIRTNNMTVLVGKNNEGKSNILRALTLAMNVMKAYAEEPRSATGNSLCLASRISFTPA